MPDTPLSSVLEDMRSRHYRVDAPGLPGYPLKPGESMSGSDHHRWPCHAHILGGAVAAVLEVHKPADRGRVMPCCEGCEKADSASPAGCHEWPCPTVEAITRKLLGEEPGDD